MQINLDAEKIFQNQIGVHSFNIFDQSRELFYNLKK